MFIELTSFYKFRILTTCKNKLEYLACAPRRRCLGSVDIGIDCYVDMLLDVDVLVLLTLLPRHDTFVDTKLESNHVYRAHKFL
jgi:hypothetical protein